MKKIWPLLLLLAAACKQKEFNADLIIKNAVVYTVDSAFTTADAFVVNGGKIIAVGEAEALEEDYHPREVIDADGKAVYPGFIDAHSHFYEYGVGLQQVNLRELNSWHTVTDSVQHFAQLNPEGWLLGSGWDQNLWEGKKFPDKARLDSLFPVRPVLLSRIDGHAAIANQAALDIAGIKPGQKIIGGDIEVIDGKLTGILLDNAVGIVTRKIPAADEQAIQNALLSAQTKCFEVGLTTVDDAGLPSNMVGLINQLQKKNELKMRMYVMLADRPESYDYFTKNGILKTPRLSVRAIKMYADGALGSRGACLLQPYSDKEDSHGFLLSTQQHFQEVAAKLANTNVQLNTHAIGDSANRVMLKIYADVLKGKNDKRWRIEHAQIVSPEDLHYFGDYSIIPSVQPTHATSDMAWAVKRLGPDRLKTAYAYKNLMKQNGWIALGTDFPVENINPLYTFYAAVVRKDHQGQPAKGFQTENAINRAEALKGITIWAAKANFEEKEKGSIEPGKYADFVILDTDIMKAKPDQLLKAKVLKSFINGEKVYEKK